MITFEDQTEIYKSCSLLWRNKIMVFGGVNESRQISTIDQCSLTRVGKLEFSFNYGACTSAHDQIYLCFGISAEKQCYTASGLVSHKNVFCPFA